MISEVVVMVVVVVVVVVVLEMVVVVVAVTWFPFLPQPQVMQRCPSLHTNHHAHTYKRRL